MATTTTKRNPVNDALDTLERSIAEICEGDNFQRWLDMAARFHRYSWGNLLLIQRQFPEARHVAGYTRWQSMGRQVRKGERAIRILAPAGNARYVVENEDGEPEERQGRMRFRAAAVFDISQTEPIEGKVDVTALAPKPGAIEGEAEITAALDRALEDWLRHEGVTLERGDTGAAEGWYRADDNTIRISVDLTGDKRLSTLLHETAHWRAGHAGGISRPDAETVAEASAYVVLRHYGIDTTDHSAPYIAGWAKDPKILKANLAAIQRTAAAMIDATAKRITPEA